jgi:hypothetical protein
VCNGENGTNGTNETNGTNGAIGFDTLVSIVTDTTYCANGGLRVNSGLDNGTMKGEMPEEVEMLLER